MPKRSKSAWMPTISEIIVLVVLIALAFMLPQFRMQTARLTDGGMRGIMEYTVTGSSESSDPNAWLMFGRFLNHSRYNPVTGPAILTNVSWFETEDAYTSFPSSPIVWNGIVYIGSMNGVASNSSGTLYALNASNISQQIWNYTIENSVTGGWIDSSPAVADGVVYFGARDGNVYALNASTGAFLGSYQTGDWISSSPAIVNGTLYIGSGDGYVYALNASNISQQLANFSTNWSIDYSSPAFADGVIYIGNYNGTLYALNASNISQQLGSFATGDRVASSPTVANGVVYVGSDDGNLYALNAGDLSYIANYTAGVQVHASPAVANGIAYIGSTNGTLYALNASDITQVLSVFSAPQNAAIFSSPAVADGIVYIGTWNNSASGQLYALNASNISRVLSAADIRATFSSPIAINGTVYIGSQRASGSGRVYAFGMPETVPPMISNISVSGVTDISATVSWITDELANSTINYGNTTALGTFVTNASLVTNHSIRLTGLSANTTYYYNVTSCDAAGNCNTTGPYNFTTLLSDGSPCAAPSECSGGYCVHGICRSSPTHCGDGYCDSGETCSNCQNDCGTCAPSGGGQYSAGIPPAEPQPTELKMNVVARPGACDITIDYAPANSTVRVDTSPANTTIQNITFVTTRSIRGANISIRRAPRETYQPGTAEVVYDVINVTQANLNGNIENVSVQFKVGKDWVAENAVDPSTVTLARRADGGEWEELETTPVGEDAENYYFSAASTGLSTFATVAVSMSLQCQAVCVSGEWSECMNGEQSRIAMSCDENYKCVPHVEKRKCGVEEQPSVPKLPLDIIIIPVIGLAVGSYLIFSRKRF